MKIEDEFYYESGAIMQIILEKYANGKLMPAANTNQRGDTKQCMQAEPASTTVVSKQCCWFAGKFLQWMWFVEGTFTPPMSELHHHKLTLPDDKKVPEV